jgi:hypothetical protein
MYTNSVFHSCIFADGSLIHKLAWIVGGNKRNHKAGENAKFVVTHLYVFVAYWSLDD